MIKHLKIENLKGLKECTLPDLQQVNVFCGKNNSGKSTILDAINSDQNRFVGIEMYEAIVDSFVASTAHEMYLSVLMPEKAQYKACVENTAKAKEVWFQNDADNFVDLLEKNFKKNSLFKKHSFQKEYIKKAYNKSFNDDLKIILLPAKRNLEINIGYNSSQGILPPGSGVSNYLLFAKNQRSDSTDRTIFDQIQKAFSKISSGYKFDIFTQRNNNQIELCFAFKDQQWINALACGLGLQDLLILLYFSISPSYDVILIEEPESHIHPDMQRKLLHFLKNETSKQYFITTHSNVFLDNLLVDKIFLTYFDDSVKVEEVTSRAWALKDLGYSVNDNLLSDLTILVEGPTDKIVIEEFLKQLGVLNKYEIKIWPLGGDIMDQLDLSVFSEKYNIIALIDQDPKSDSIRKQFIKNCQNHHIPVERLKRYSIENYLSLRALREIFSKQIPVSLTTIDPDKKLEEQIGLSTKKNARKIAQAMTLDEIKNTDDLFAFLEKVESMCTQNSNRQKP